MEFVNAVLIGIVEGLTEFLPVSSTGHIIMADEILGFQGPAGKVFEVSIQLGAILAICWLYRNKLVHVLCNLWRDRNDQRFTLNVTLAFLPAAIIGAFAHGYITEYLFNTRVVAVSLIVGGIAILLIEKFRPAATVKTLDDITPLRALGVGFCQCVAMIPGVSRSGATIMGAMLLRVERQAAAEFSFFLAIPTMFAATAYDLYKNHELLTQDAMAIIGVGFVTAFFSALLVVRWFVGFISRHGFTPFAWYRIVAGSLLLYFVWG